MQHYHVEETGTAFVYPSLSPGSFIHTLSNKYEKMTFSVLNTVLSTGVSKTNMVSNPMGLS